MNLLNAMKTNFGRNLISLIIGVGIASLFRKSCEGSNCMVFKGPEFDKVNKKIYKFNNKCYKFKEKLTKCNPDNKDKVFF